MKIKSSIALIAALALSTTAALATTFATNATIAAGNTTYDGQPIIVSNCTLTVNGPHSFASLQVISNAVLTHSAAPNGEASNLLSLTIAGNLGVDSSSEIDVSGLGYAKGAGPGAGTYWTSGNYANCGSGAGHGGTGGSTFVGGVGGGVYDSLLTPSLWGSGSAGGDDAAGGAGGGVICLAVAGTLQVDGVIAADGVSVGFTAGGGAGGSIQISAGTLAGGGSISAQGGSTPTNGGGGGGGGRIALYLTQNTFGGNITAAGGLGFQNGGAGAIYTVSGPPPPLCPNAAAAGSALCVSWSTGSGGSYQIWSSPDLVHWSLYGPVRVGTGGILTQDCPMTNWPCLFFRVQLGN